MTQQELKGLLGLVTAIYGGKFASTEETASAWWWILQDENAGQAVDALKAYAKTGEPFPPVPGQILQEIKRAKKLPAYKLFELPAPVAKGKTAAELVALAKTELSKKMKDKSVK